MTSNAESSDGGQSNVKTSESSPTAFDATYLQFFNKFGTLVGKMVEVHFTSSQQDHGCEPTSEHGLLYTIDPVTSLVYLVRRKEETAMVAKDSDTPVDIKIFNLNTVEKIVARSDLQTFELVLDRGAERSNADPGNAAAQQERKARIITQLNQNRIAYEEMEDGVLRVLNGILRIQPPYRLKDCVSKNETVLQRLTSVLNFD